MFINIAKANLEIGRLKEEVANMTKDRDSQLTKLKEFEIAHKETIEASQTVAQLKEAHNAELETLKATITEKDKEIALLKESHQKEIASVKEASEQTISTVKESVTKETIALVASQGTNAAIEIVLPEKSAQGGETSSNKKAKYKITSYVSKQNKS